MENTLPMPSASRLPTLHNGTAVQCHGPFAGGVAAGGARTMQCILGQQLLQQPATKPATLSHPHPLPALPYSGTKSQGAGCCC